MPQLLALFPPLMSASFETEPEATVHSQRPWSYAVQHPEEESLQTPQGFRKGSLPWPGGQGLPKFRFPLLHPPLWRQQSPAQGSADCLLGALTFEVGLF